MNTQNENKYTGQEVKEHLDAYLHAQEDEYDEIDIKQILIDESYAEDIDRVLQNHWQSTHSQESPSEALQEIKTRINAIENRRRDNIRKLITYTVATAAVIAIVIGGYIFQTQNRHITPKQAIFDPIVETVEKPISVEILEPEFIAETPAVKAEPKVDVEVTLPEITSETESVKIEIAQPPKPMEIVEHTVPHGEELKLSLADGSNVTLGGGSKISYKEDMNNGTRVVALTGKAYFEVARDDHKPFKVEASDITITVLGTMFDVHAYPEETLSRIKLDKGSITVTTPNGMEFHMQPGEELTYNHQTSSADIKREKKATPVKRSKQKNNK